MYSLLYKYDVDVVVFQCNIYINIYIYVKTYVCMYIYVVVWVGKELKNPIRFQTFDWMLTPFSWWLLYATRLTDDRQCIGLAPSTAKSLARPVRKRLSWTLSYSLNPALWLGEWREWVRVAPKALSKRAHFEWKSFSVHQYYWTKRNVTNTKAYLNRSLGCL